MDNQIPLLALNIEFAKLYEIKDENEKLASIKLVHGNIFFAFEIPHTVSDNSE